MTLEYWREYPTYFSLGQRYKIAENTCFRNVKWIEDVLVKSGEFALPNKQNVMEDKNIKTIIVDSTSTKIEKPLKKHKKYYTGKQKIYVIKTQLSIDLESGQILQIITSNAGKHDFKLWKKNKKILADFSYQGINKRHKKSYIPVKKNVKNS